MINTLFLMHNIKYIICVDDCFFAQKRREMEAAVYSDMCKSIEPFRVILSTCGFEGLVDEIAEMMDLKVDSSVLIQSLLERLEEADLLQCYEICEHNGTTYADERNMILSFLDDLKEEGLIANYITFSSTSEANAYNVQEAGMIDGAILWLLDRNFSRVGESEESGLSFAEQKKRHSRLPGCAFFIRDQTHSAPFSMA